MKLAFTVATPEVNSRTILAYTGPLEESIPILADLGYDGVEFMVRSPRELDANKIEKLVVHYDLLVPVIGTGQLAGEDGLTLTDPDPYVRETAVARFKDVVDFAARFGARINVGRLRGRILEGVSRELSVQRMRDGFLQMLDYAAEREVGVVLEPQNRSVINFVNTVAEAVGLIAELGRDNLGTMVDTYHANIEEKSIAAALVRARDRLWYVHVGDSNRLAPGKGHLNFPEIIEVLKACDYEGFVTAEILQQPDHESAAKQAIDYLSMVI
jgi:sugar phosphate isomerase/epimerase